MRVTGDHGHVSLYVLDVSARHEVQALIEAQAEHYRSVATILQQALLTDLPEVHGLTLAARYLAATADDQVGGDWHDAVLQPDGSPLTWTSVRGNLPFVATYEAVLTALGDRTRRQIVEALHGGPVAVGDLEERIAVSRPAISQHLKVLQACELVDYESVGTRHVYRLDSGGLRELRDWLDEFWGVALAQFARRAAVLAADGSASPRSVGGEL